MDTITQKEGTSLGKPVSAQYARMFELSAAAAAEALDHARDAAVAAGWTRTKASGERGFVAEKRAASGRLELAVVQFRDALLLPADVKPPALQITLRHVG